MKLTSLAACLFSAAMGLVLPAGLASAENLPGEGGPRLWLSNQEVDALLAEGEKDPTAITLDFDEDRGVAPRRWWPVVASALVPGLGESLTGHRRGWFMIAADAGLWYGVVDRNNEGNDIKDQYEAFAEQHWSETEWANALAAGRTEEFFGFGPGTVPDEVPLYVSRAEDEREWFENLGKWDVFAWGWREYWDDTWNTAQGYPFLQYQPGAETPFYADNVFMTPLRSQYVDMRVASNDAFETRDTLVNVAILLRVFSVLQVAYLEGFIGGRYAGAGPESGPVRAGWFVSPEGRDGGQLGWKVSY